MNKSKPIPANVAAIWGAFLYEGMMACSFTKIREQQVLKQWGLGCVELMAGACALLPEVWRQIEPRWYESQFPGVFEYDVISPLGVSIGDYIILNQGCLPPREVLEELVRELIEDFFLSQPARAPVYNRDETGAMELHH